MPRAIKNPEPHWLNQINAAHSCGVSKQTFRSWGITSVATLGNQKYYTVADILANRIERSHKRGTNGSGGIGRQEALEKIDAAKLAEIEERTENIALKNAVLKKEYAPIALLEWSLGKIGSQVSAVLESIPVKLKRRCPHLSTQDLQIVKEEIIKCQNLAAETSIDLDEYEAG